MRSKEEHEQWLIEQYNRNRPASEHVKNIAEFNRAMLDKEIKLHNMTREEMLEKQNLIYSLGQ